MWFAKSLFILVIVTFYFSSAAISQSGEEENEPSFKSIQDFCEKTLKQLGEPVERPERPEKDDSSSKENKEVSSKENKEVSLEKLNRMVEQERKAIYDIYTKKRKMNKWNYKNTEHLHYMIKLGLFKDAYNYAIDFSSSRIGWVQAGCCHFYLAYLSRRLKDIKDKSESERWMKMGQEMMKKFEEWLDKKRTKKSEGWCLQSAQSAQKNAFDKIENWEKNYPTFVELQKTLRQNPKNFDKWKDLIRYTGMLEFRSEQIAYIQMLYKLTKKEGDADVDTLLLQLAEAYMATDQSERAISTVEMFRLEKPEGSMIKTKAYLEMKDFDAAENELSLIKRKYPDFVKRKFQEIKDLEKRMDERW